VRDHISHPYKTIYFNLMFLDNQWQDNMSCEPNGSKYSSNLIRS
jgi:hypothetical protein